MQPGRQPASGDLRPREATPEPMVTDGLTMTSKTQQHAPRWRRKRGGSGRKDVLRGPCGGGAWGLTLCAYNSLLPGPAPPHTRSMELWETPLILAKWNLFCIFSVSGSSEAGQCDRGTCFVGETESHAKCRNRNSSKGRGCRVGGASAKGRRPEVKSGAQGSRVWSGARCAPVFRMAFLDSWKYG